MDKPFVQSLGAKQPVSRLLPATNKFFLVQIRLLCGALGAITQKSGLWGATRNGLRFQASAQTIAAVTFDCLQPTRNGETRLANC